MIANAPVGGVGSGPAGIAYTGSYNTVQTPKLGVGRPESAQAKCGSFGVTGQGLVDGRDCQVTSRLNFHTTPAYSELQLL